MYAVVTTGGKQVRVSEGDVIRVEKLEAQVGDTVELDQVHFLSGDKGAVLDSAALDKAKVVCEVTGQGRRKKIRVFKMKRRKNYHRTQGHRQCYTELKVQKIQA
ncbi:MAG: 50S ribosomal protein L21 [Candidatus Hydrogenedentota bacterium]|nr:MAG: 50S ribosomal protein L21 [Candidatus Hydrogenedentota bacterium]